jgi:zinc protease
VRRAVIAALCLLSAWPCSALEQTLGNGVRVILIQHRANPMVASAVVVGAGVVDESPSASGASHFLEHLLFNGTTTRTQRQLYDDVDKLGAYNNATTREDHTLFTLLVAKAHAEEGLAIQADMLFRSTIPGENFEKERKIVLEELARDRSDPSYEPESAFRAFAFSETPIARPVLGTEASLGAITRPQVLAYYKARYVPGNMTLVVMGDFEIPEMLAAVQRTFGAVPPSPAPKAGSSRWPAVPKENVEIAGAEKGPTRMLAAFPLEAQPWDDVAVAAEILLAAASDGKDSPLARALEARGVKTGESSLGTTPRRAPWSTVGLDVEIESGADPKAVLDAVCEAVRSTRSGGEARGRLDRVLAKLESEAVIARDQIHYFAMLRSSSILGSPKGSLENETARLAALTPANWDAASERLIAALPALRARIAGPGLTPGHVSWAPAAESRKSVEVRPATLVGTLPNGLRYAVRQDFDSDVFALHLAFVPRSSAEAPGQEGITDLLHRAVARATIVHDQASLQDRLSWLGARVKAVDDPSVPFDDYYTTPEFSWLRLEVPGSRWREAVGLLAEMVRFPSLTADALDDARREMQERVSRRDASPRDAAATALDTMLAPGHPLTRPVYGTDASLRAITLDALTSYHAAWAAGKRMIVTVIGPVSPDDVRRALSSDFGPLPAGDASPPAPPPPLTEGTALVTRELSKSQSYVAMGSVIDLRPEDRAPLTIAVAMLSDRLAFELRETKGLAYSIGASLRPWGGRTRLDVSMGTRAQNLDDARAGILSALQAFRDGSPGEADVERAINGATGTALMRRMTRISLAYEAGLEVLRGEQPGDERAFVDALRRVTASDVKRVAAAYLDPGRLAVAVVR